MKHGGLAFESVTPRAVENRSVVHANWIRQDRKRFRLSRLPFQSIRADPGQEDDCNFIENASRLCEQEFCEQECCTALAATALEMYVKRWATVVACS
jgi:hypothetical protein